ncbi:putative SMP-30/Gluconolaconase/LRE-like region [Colletotrichum sublineola]|uniref:Putative SMP-30/Gluconolaconase/LRE-like region n=1 Tax=Colletotrichum sublineola TaxID=1173701 RepID=A0A066WV08_COLSU|nr:putative SMP-30/Gluconolaconase/LRE-like region [Colletotrichum sublineola]
MTDNPAFVVYDGRVKKLYGPAPKLEVLHENQDYPFAHEAGVFIERNNTLFITSNQFNDQSGGRKIQICRVRLPDSGGTEVTCEEIHPATVAMANGGVNYLDGVVFCSQGTMDAPGGLVFMEAEPPYQTRMLVSSFHGRAFNSVNDVVVHSDGSLWFTDPIYGYEQGIRPSPQLPNQVYRYDPIHGSIRAMADGFGRPNGICFSPDEKIVYVTDTDWIHGDGSTDLTRASTM